MDERDMCYTSQLITGSTESQTSIRMQEKVATMRENRIEKSLDYSELENPFYIDQRHVGPLQTVMNHNEPIKDDGLGKHMRDFGVLDWGRLENWKSNEKHISPRFNSNTTLLERRSLRFSRNLKKIQETPNGSPLSSSSSDRLPPRARSYSLKESTNQTSSDSINYNWKKASATNPSRSSPLRRFLNPLLKPKGAHLAERVQKSKLEPTPSTAPMHKNGLLQSKKHRSSHLQALLQLTLKNGIPFFKLVVESSSDLLAAAVKKLPSGKDDSSLIYTFYSVHETKKKSGGWMYQSSKGKSYCFEYDIVGQMKISSSYQVEFSGPEKGLYVVQESVLYSSETMLADQTTLDCMLEGELAAIIVKNSIAETQGDIGSSRTTIVVLPDCVHSWPDTGLSSPLLNRWKSGGACDCGGWDIGCQFHVLSNHQNELTIPSASNHLELCNQVGHKNKCSLRLVSVENGLYSLEYDPSMSLVQAFSICVAVVSSQKLTHIFEVNCGPESKDLSKAIPIDNKKVNSQVSKPPVSAVARV